MPAVVFYFQVHQPYRLRRYTRLEVGKAHDWFADGLNREIVQRVAERCYVPMNRLLGEAIERTEGRFRCSFSISGTALEQMEAWAPEALESFVALAETGCVEFLCETSCHSLSALADPDEFARQVGLQRARIERLFGVAPRTFRNTELVIDNAIARAVEELGFDTLLGEGADRLLEGRSPHHLYRTEGCERLTLMLRDYVHSDDIAFRFSNKEWPAYPLMADTFAGWLHTQVPETADVVGLFMDYETFGEHQWAETGILDFMQYLPEYVLADPRFEFRTPAEAAAALEPVETLDVPAPVSWADAERDLTAWLGNPMQREAHEALYRLGTEVRRVGSAHPELTEAWRKLTTSDHVYYMCTKFLSDQDVHEYFSPYDSPHEAFINFMNVLEDLSGRLERSPGEPEAAAERTLDETPRKDRSSHDE